MVGVAQSVEHQVVALGAAGSSPVTHPIFFVIQAVGNVQFCLSSRKTKILTADIHQVFRGSKFESDAEIGQKGMFYTA